MAECSAKLLGPGSVRVTCTFVISAKVERATRTCVRRTSTTGQANTHRPNLRFGSPPGPRVLCSHRLHSPLPPPPLPQWRLLPSSSTPAHPRGGGVWQQRRRWDPAGVNQRPHRPRRYGGAYRQRCGRGPGGGAGARALARGGRSGWPPHGQWLWRPSRAGRHWRRGSGRAPHGAHDILAHPVQPVDGPDRVRAACCNLLPQSRAGAWLSMGAPLPHASHTSPTPQLCAARLHGLRRCNSCRV